MARVAVITGASSGIGLVTAKALASKGWRIIGQGRDPGRMAAAEAEIRAAARPGVPVDMLRADLSLLSEAARLADEIATITERIDVLINNAGGASKAQVITAEGNEATFAGNHLGHFVLTNRLSPLLRETASRSGAGDVRILNTSSSASEYTPGLNWDDLQMFNDFESMRAYCNVKLANVLFTRALASRLADAGIVAHAMHPGAVDTNFVNRAPQHTQEHMRKNGMVSAEEGADTLIWLADASEAGTKTGEYWYERAPRPVNPFADDPMAAERLWRESQKLAEESLPRSGVHG